MSDKSVIIIGGGIAGLSVGCYSQMNGYRTRIYEMHHNSGGLCTSWQRNGYNINGGVHIIVGCGKKSNFYRIWEELGAVQGIEFLHFEDFVSFEGTDGRTFTLHGNIDKLENHMMNVAPEDHNLIADFINGVRRCVSFNPPILKMPELYGPVEGLSVFFKIAPHLRLFRKWFKISMYDFAQRFKSTLLRELFSELWFPDSPVFFFMMMLASLHQKSSGYPMGGSLPFSESIERRYLALGGQCYYNSKVSKIIVKNNKAMGIKLEDGTEQWADYIISAADGYTTIFKMLDEKYSNKKIRNYYKKLPIFPALIQISIGMKQSRSLNSSFTGNSTGLNLPLQKPVMIAGEQLNRLGIRVHDFDSTAVPIGKTLIKILIPSDLNYWKPLYEDRGKYEAEKEQIYNKVVSILDKRFPGLANLIEMYDVTTPITSIHYTGNWKGSHQGWMLTPKTGILRMKNVLPGLDNFFMAGHWVAPGGGVPTAALSGRNVTQLLCKKDKKPFVTTVP
ncbi:MAG: NAD(P)/FAD-dependent oxidoreductase [Sedimentisphaerales bacterium]|nr:NAD(P)/FAD-dependent oxidoreductase [Sedimentisphaerales bacterium]